MKKTTQTASSEQIKRMLEREREDQAQKNKLAITRHKMRRESLRAYEDLCRMCDVPEKWIEDDRRYDDFCENINRVISLCDVPEDYVTFIDDLNDDIFLPSSRNKTERAKVLEIARYIVNVFEMPQK